METLRMGLVPDLLTIEEAARVLRIGRTKAYAMGQEWRATDGASGLKVSEFGGQLRVPRIWIEEQLGAPLRSIPQRPEQGAATPHDSAGVPADRAATPTPATEAEQETLELPLPPSNRSQDGPGPAPKKSPRAQRRSKPRANADQLTLPFD